MFKGIWKAFKRPLKIFRRLVEAISGVFEGPWWAFEMAFKGFLNACYKQAKNTAKPLWQPLDKCLKAQALYKTLQSPSNALGLLKASTNVVENRWLYHMRFKGLVRACLTPLKGGWQTFRRLFKGWLFETPFTLFSAMFSRRLFVMLLEWLLKDSQRSFKAIGSFERFLLSGLLNKSKTLLMFFWRPCGPVKVLKGLW